MIGLQGEYSWQSRYTPIIALDGSNFRTSNKVVGPLFKLELSAANLEIMRKLGIFTLGDLLAKEKLNNFEQTLFLGIEWFSRYQIQSELKNKLLNHITVLETFLTPTGDDPIQRSIAEGVAILLEDDVLARKSLIKKIKKLYTQRSKISHGYNKEILDIDVKELSIIAGSLIMTLIGLKDQFESKQELINWIEFKRLGGLSENWIQYKESIKDSALNKTTGI